jgi:hypothetical protein
VDRERGVEVVQDVPRAPGFPVLTRAKLESIGLPLREMAPDEVIDSSFLFNPPNSPDVMSRTKAARELEKLLKP